MKRRDASVILVAILFMSVFCLAVITVPDNVRANTLFVGGSGPSNYTVIQDAIDASSHGDTIFVYNGTYNEHVTVDRTLSLVGEDRNGSIIDGGGVGFVVNVTADWVNISGFTVTGSGEDTVASDAGIQLSYAWYCNISHNNVSSNNMHGIKLFHSYHNLVANNSVYSNGWTGITLGASNDNLVFKNLVSSNTYGISVGASRNVVITNNTVLDTMFHGVGIHSSRNVIVTGNMLVNNGIDISGNHVVYWNTHEIDTSNLINGKPTYYWKDVTGGRVPSDAGQVILANCMGVLVEEQNIRNSTTGIILGFSSGNVVTNNTISDSKWGIELWYSGNNQILNSTFSNMRTGVSVWYSTGNTVANNTAFSHSFTGFHFSSSNNNVLANNTSPNNIYGISFHYSDHNTIISNILSRNVRGVFFERANNNTIVNNAISHSLKHGFYIYYSYDNHIYHNDIAYNDMQVYDDNSINQWDDGYPSGGNYWSDYLGVDNMNGPNQDQPGADAIGDTPYIVDADDRDRYPLMDPYGPLLTVPSAPQNLGAVGGIQQITLNWTAPLFDGGSPISNYRIYRRDSSCQFAFLVGVGNVLTYLDMDVTAGQTYYYYVTAVNGVGEGPMSNVDDARTLMPPTVPTNPQNLEAIPGDTNVSLSWDPPVSDGNSPITNYRVHRGNSSGGEIFLVEIGNLTAYLDTGLTNGQTYYYTVSAVNAVGEGPHSTEAYATPFILKVLPSEPRNLQALAGSGNISLTWEPPLFDGNCLIIHYRVFRGTTSGGETNLVELGNVTSFEDLGLTNGQEYFYQVSVVNLVGEGPRSNEASATPTEPPHPPTMMQADLAGEDAENVSILWSLSLDDGSSQNSVVGYAVHRSTSYDFGGLGYGIVGYVPDGETQFIDHLAGEGNPHNYFYFVCAIDLNNLSSCSTNQAGKFTRNLSEGVNLASIPLVQSDESVAKVLQTVKFDKAWTHIASDHDDPWKSYMTFKPYKGDLKTVDHRMGIWINVTEDSNLTVAGLVPSFTDINLEAGWNLVTFPSFYASYSVSDLKAETGATKVEGFDSQAPPYHLRVMNDGEFLQAGHSYWIYIESDRIWTVTNS